MKAKKIEIKPPALLTLALKQRLIFFYAMNPFESLVNRTESYLEKCIIS